MTERRPQSLTHLKAVFGDGPLYAASPDDVITVDGIELVSGYEPLSTADRFYIVKQPPHVARLRELAGRFRDGVIVELGIAEGGSTALIALDAAPRRLVAVDIEPERLAALDELVEARGLGDVVRAHYGIDQADRAGLAAVVDGELGDEPIDLVIDDASQMLEPTRTSFEVLFPRLRPGGLYAIEDWDGDHVFRDAVIRSLQEASPEERARFAAEVREQGPDRPATPPRRPLTDLAVELVLARATEGCDAIDSVTVDEFWITVRRGPGHLDRDGFRLSSLFRDHHGYLP